MKSNCSRCSRRFPFFHALAGVLLIFSGLPAGAQTTARKGAAADSLLIAVNNVAMAGEYSLRGFTPSFAFPVMSMISVTDDSGNAVPGLADTLRWLGRNENAQIGLPVSQIWRPLLEYHRDNAAFPPDPDIYNQTPGPYFTEVRKSTPFPTSTMLVMDVSGSMGEAIEDAKAANRIYVDLLRGFDRGGVIQFSDSIVHLQKMTDSKEALRATIDLAQPRGGTAIYRALALAIQEIKREASRRRAIILYTDGNNNVAGITARAVIDSAQTYGIPIFTIALGGLTSEDTLKVIARTTGGLFFKSPTAREMSVIYRRLSDLIQNFYVMAHASTDPQRNNTWRIVDVTAALPTRAGRGLGQYFVPGPVPPPGQTDLALGFTSLTDTSIVVNNRSFNAARPGEAYAYRLSVRNQGAAASENVRLSQFLPDSVKLLASSQPLLFNDGDSLAWQIARLAAGEEDSILVTVQLAAAIPNDLTDLTSRASLFAANDTSTSNNTATDTVKVFRAPLPLQTDLAVRQSAQTDSFAVVGNDTLRFAAAGETYSYQITVRNLGSVAAQNVVVTDFLPDSIRAGNFQPLPDLSTADSLQWRLGDLPPLAQVTLRFDATVAGKMPAGTNFLINKVSASAGNEDPARLANNVAIDTVQNIVSPPPPLRATDLALNFVSLTDTSILLDGNLVRAVQAGAQYQYRIKVANLGPAQAGNIRVRQTLPDSVRLIAAMPAPALAGADSLLWEISALQAGREDSIALTVQLAANVPFDLDRLLSRADVFAANDTTPANNAAHDTVYVLFPQPLPQRAKLSVRQFAQTDSFSVSGDDTLRFARAGETYSYFLSVSNESVVIARNVTLADLLPDSVRAGNFQPAPGFISRDSLLWNLGNITPRGRLAIRFEATVSRFMPVGTNLLINKIAAHAENEDPAQLGSHTGTDTVYNIVPPLPPAVDIAVFQRAQTDSFAVTGSDTLRFAAAGETYSYEIIVRNLGTASAENVILTDYLPDSIRAGAFEPAPSLIAADSITWQIGNLPAFNQVSLRFHATVAANMPAGTNLLVNKVIAHADNENPAQLANNASSDTVYNRSGPLPGAATDLALSFSSITDTSVMINGKAYNAARPGEAFAYRLRLTNLGPAAAQNILVQQFLPDSVRVLSSSQPPSSAGADSLAWQINRLEAGRVDSITIAVQLAAQIPAALQNLISRARLFAANDTSSGNDSASDTVKVLPGAPPPLQTDLAVVQRAQTDSFAVVGNDTLRFAAAGETYSYRLTVRNTSATIAQNVVVTNFLPDSILAGSFQPAPDLVAADSLQWRLGNVLPLSQIVLQFEATVAANMPAGTNFLINKNVVRADNENPALLGDNVSVDTVYNVVKPPPPSNNTDLLLNLAAVTDTNIVIDGKLARAVRPGEEYEYRISIRNRGPAPASAIRVTQFLPDSVQFLRAAPAPVASHEDSLQWQINQLAPGREDSIAVAVRLAAAAPPDLLRLISSAGLFAANDTTPSNNAASDTAYVLFRQPPAAQAILTVRQMAQTDSFAVSGGDTAHYARAGETYSYLLTVSNASSVLAQNVTLTDFLPDSIRAGNFQPAPATIASDSLHWQLGNLTPGAKLSLRFDATVSRFMPPGTNLLVNTIVAHAANEDPAQSGNVSVDTVYNLVKPAQVQPPLIEARPPVVNVRDSVFVRVQVLAPIVKWDLWVYLADGRIDSNYADAFIAATPLTPNSWFEVAPAFTNTRLFTAAKSEQIIFEIRTRDVFGLAGIASATVVVQSNNDMVLDRNVYEPDRQGPLQINFKLSSNRAARLDVYDLAGHHVTNLTEAPYAAGWNTYSWNGFIAERGYPAGSGVYLIVLRSGEYDDWKKVIIAR